MHLLKVWSKRNPVQRRKTRMGVESARFHGVVNGESL